MISPSETSYLTFVAMQAALKAGDILRKGFGCESIITAKPGHQNIVTEYDKASEDCIISLIAHNFPDHSFLAEESGATRQKKDSIVWIIDPLDGTSNFARHLPFFTISIAAYYQEQGLCGVIYQPITNELFVAEKNKGAFLNGSRLSVSPLSQLSETTICVGASYNSKEHPFPYIEHFANLLKLGVSFRNLGSAALGLAYVAAGKMDGFWMDYLYPWDIAAGKLLVEEAGGKVTLYSGEPYTVSIASNVLATNNIIHNKMLTHLK